MIWKIARKELLSNLITFRFSSGTALFLALVVFFTLLLTGVYNQKLERYNQLVSRNNEELSQLMTYQNLKPTIYKPPELLSIFSKGVEANLAKAAQVSVASAPVLAGAYTEENPMLSVFPEFDIVLIFKIVISLLVFLFIYDSISGEKEDKTLALMLSNSIPKHHVLMGKFVGSLITIVIPLTTGFLAVGLILSISPAINLTASDWLRIILIFLASLVMVGTLCCFGLFISSLTKKASDTLIFLFFLWSIFVFVIPNAGTYLANRIIPNEPREKIDLQAENNMNEFRKKVGEYMRQIPREGYIVQSDAQEPWGYYHSYASKGKIRFNQQLYAFAGPLEAEYVDKEWRLRKNYLESLIRQKKLAEMISRISPLSMHEHIISALSRSDLASFERFYQQAAEYRRQLLDYLDQKNAFSSIRYTSSVKEEHLFYVKNSAEYSELRKKYENVKALPLNLDDLPRFQYISENFPDTLKRILPGVVLLSITGILFFLCAFAAFLKYDVR